MLKILFIAWLLIINFGCTDIAQGTFHSNKLVSSKGEKVFVNSINWGVSDDHQLSIISKDRLRLKDRKDTIGAVYGLDPFIYQFKHDTLTLFFYDHVSYKIADDLNTITVLYKVVSSSELLVFKEKTYRSTEYFSIPKKVN